MNRKRKSILFGDGDVREAADAIDWTLHPLGPIETWPQSLQTIVGVMMHSKFPKYIAWGPDRILIYNDAYIPLVGSLRHPQAFGAKFKDVWYELWAQFEPMMLAVDRGESLWFEDHPMLTQRKGFDEQAFFTFSYSPIYDESQEVAGVLCSCFETTEQKIAEAALQYAKLEAEKANSSKSSFLANMSHEIRTPMTAVLGFTEILRNSNLSDAERDDALLRIDRSGRTLLQLIDDVLDISKVESGRLTIEKVRFSPYEVVMEVTSLLKLQADQKNLELTTSFDSNVPELASSDPFRLRQILTNLLGNAVKFTPSGKVSIHVKTDSEGEKKFLVFDVKDTGIGIQDIDQEKLFQPFAQADQSITRQFGGSGLGLLLSRRLAQHLGGNLTLVHSEKGVGSHFRAYIEAGPFSKKEVSNYARQLQTDAQVEIPSLNSAWVLVVDDVPDNQLLMRKYLEGAGARVDVASDGEEGISKAMSRNYDVVLMDIQMPRVDGIQATKRLRAQGYQRPILALTAHAMREEVSRSIDAGCDEHLTKPVTRAHLISAVGRHVH